MSYKLFKLAMISFLLALTVACSSSSSDDPNNDDGIGNGNDSSDSGDTTDDSGDNTDDNVATADIGLSTSVLNDSHRFDNPSSRVRVSVSNSASVAGNLDYTIRFTNLTNNQPISPVAVILHRAGYASFTDGVSASTNLEQMAEGGDNSFIISEAMAAAEYITHDSTAGPVPPKSIASDIVLSLPAVDADDVRLTVLGMLVNTNDAFTGLNAMDISNMTDGDVRSFNAPTWDSGTELNTETAASMPGPAAGGEGFNSARDDIFDRVHFHTGVVTNALADI